MEYIVIGLVVLVALFVIMAYNRLVRLRNQVNNAWHQIDVQLQRRFDLVPNLVNTVKGYMEHERRVLEEVTRARTSFLSADSVEAKAEAENMLTGALRTLFAVSENYPDLKASENFRLLQEQLEGVENRIAYARQAYNDNVMLLNKTIELFPYNLLAGSMGFSQREYFQTEDQSVREPVTVEF